MLHFWGNGLVNLTNTFFVSDEFIFFLVYFGFVRTWQYIMLTLSEMVLFKILYLYKYSKIAVMDEYFLTNFVTFFNSITIFCFTVIRIQLGEHKKTRLYFQNFAEPFEIYRKVDFP